MRSEGAFFSSVSQSAGCGFDLTLERLQRGWGVDANIDNARPLWAWERAYASQVDVEAVEGICLGVDHLRQGFHVRRWDVAKKF